MTQIKSSIFRQFYRTLCSENKQPALALKNDQIIPHEFHNRNPRNLERLRIAYKPTGYHLEKPGREFWHKYKKKKNQFYIH